MNNKEPEKLTNKQKKEAMEAIKSFFDSIEGPNDIYKQIVLTILFEELLGENHDQ